MVKHGKIGKTLHLPQNKQNIANSIKNIKVEIEYCTAELLWHLLCIHEIFKCFSIYTFGVSSGRFGRTHTISICHSRGHRQGHTSLTFLQGLLWRTQDQHLCKKSKLSSASTKLQFQTRARSRVEFGKSNSFHCQDCHFFLI